MIQEQQKGEAPDVLVDNPAELDLSAAGESQPVEQEQLYLTCIS